ncbi:uncharacterized protein LOC141535991 [Cotesia typhae]|uniref:uncharacterized protein LOC141535991 n=1 Tax=Cotesia typhae TaxID=2053667 RepID=UPI003D68E797
MSDVVERSVKTQQALQQKINYMYRCDSSDFDKNGKNQVYYELERMIQVLIVNEKDLSTTQTCTANCDVKTIKNTINHKECREFRDCRFMTNSLKVCKEKEGKSKHYRWFENRYRIQFGGNRGENCSEPVQSLEGYLDVSEMRFCDYCVCTCVAQPKRSTNVVTAISFREQVTNIFQNIVVVGIRFAKKDFMIHVQIKERQLRRRRLNDSGTWKELESFDVNEQTGKFFFINNNTESPLKNLNLPYPDDPTKSSENAIDSKTNQFIKFRASDLKKDAGQSTVPFFDALEAEGDPNFPLGGIGIIHRGQKGFGGFLAFKIFELDLSQYFKT